MHELSRRESTGLIALLLLITVVVSTFSWREMHPPTTPIVIHEPAQLTAAAVSTIKVHVAGAVKKPGVYTLPLDARGEDALKVAGGALPNAAPNAINLAGRLEDGQRLEIPVKDASIEVKESVPAHSHSSGKGHTKAPPTHKANINTASKAELQTLPGIGEKTAETILLFRKANGGFRTTQDLLQVKGISQTKFKKLEPFIRAN